MIPNICAREIQHFVGKYYLVAELLVFYSNIDEKIISFPNTHRGVATGGYIGIYTPQNQSTQNNLCGYSSAVIQDR